MRRVKLSTLALLLGFGACAASEVGLRLLTGSNSRWNVRMGAHKQYDPVTQVRNKPNYEIIPEVRTNEYGYQAPANLTFAMPPDRLRLIYLGDSNTWLPVGENYPTLVERRIEAETGLEVETINAAVPGFSSENARLLFETELSRFDADYFFVYLGWNDLGQFGPEGLPYKRQDAGYALSPLQRFLSQVYSLRFLYAAQNLLHQAQPAVNEPLGAADGALYASYRPDHFYANLREILTLARSRYPRVYLMTLATLTNDDPTDWELRTAHFPTGMDKNMRKLHRLVGSYNEAVRAVAGELEVPILDLNALFLSPEARRHFRNSCHLDGEGVARVAELVSGEVLARERGRSNAAAAGD